MARFSVLLPTHNRAELVGYAIRSVLCQTETDFELLIVGDGCTDNTAEVIRSFQDSRIRWFDLPKAPHFGYANRNIALREAIGEYIAFMAHDDLVFPDHLALLADTLEKTGAEWVYSRPLWVSTDGCVVPFAVNLRNNDELEHFLTRANVIPAACVLHRRSCFQKYGYWPEDVKSAADWRFWIRIIEGGGRSNLAYCEVPTVLHFVADWKRHRASGMPQVAAGLKVADSAPWWPAPLKREIPPGNSEQQVFFAAIQSPDYVSELRRAVNQVMERMAWEHLMVIARWKMSLP
jgi:glycosyltransferase involved in cell wall biosynthesis